MDQTLILWVEGIGETQSPLINILPTLKNPGDIYYDPNWPLYVIRLSVITHSFAQYFVQYNPESGKTRSLVIFPAYQRNLLEGILDGLGSIEVDYVKEMAQDGQLDELYDCQERIKEIYREYNLSQWIS